MISHASNQCTLGFCKKISWIIKKQCPPGPPFCIFFFWTIKKTVLCQALVSCILCSSWQCFWRVIRVSILHILLSVLGMSPGGLSFTFSYAKCSNYVFMSLPISGYFLSFLSTHIFNLQLWTRMSILNTAGSSKFSSDRTIHEYAKDIWDISPVILP